MVHAILGYILYLIHGYMIYLIQVYDILHTWLCSIFSNDGDRDMSFGSLDVIENGDHYSIGFVEISKLFQRSAHIFK